MFKRGTGVQKQEALFVCCQHDHTHPNTLSNISDFFIFFIFLKNNPKDKKNREKEHKTVEVQSRPMPRQYELQPL
jgi:hypothetical protein